MSRFIEVTIPGKGSALLEQDEALRLHRELTEKLFDNKRHAIILDAVSKEWCVPIQMILSKFRPAQYVTPRHAAMALMVMFGDEQEVVAAVFKKNRSLISHVHLKVREACNHNRHFKQRFERVMENVSKELNGLTT